MGNETFIVQLKTLMTALNRIGQTVTGEIRKLEDTAARLEDESRLGSVSTYDYGLEDQSTAVKRVEKEVSKTLREIKKLSKTLGAAQTKKIAEQSGSLTDDVEKK